ncbi:MAG: MGMT family protein [Gammaproteobacteria bacterium]|nr:MGMT family protein [Gammaproteobacteria bacterium]
MSRNRTRITFSVVNKRKADSPVDSLYARIYAAVRGIPRGRVSTYGRIARLVGCCSPRQVGYAMAALPPGSRVPWQRVINHQGRISGRRHGQGAENQRLRLLQEGVRFKKAGQIDLTAYGWPE